MKRALINIDYTYDFVADDGDYVVFAIDKHEEKDKHHPETALYPPHNITGTKGRQLYGKLLHVYEQYKENENVYYMDKTRYSAFAGTDLEMKLKERGIEEVHLVGVCTDICL